MDSAIFAGQWVHAYLISGASLTARQAFADDMAKALLCDNPAAAGKPCSICVHCQKAQQRIHPDISCVLPDASRAKREILVGQIRQIVADAPLLPNEAARKVYLIAEADRLNVAAQNAFLKVLEEPPSFVTFLLLAENPDSLLVTVRSRCRHISLAPVEDSESETDDEVAARLLAKQFADAFTAGDLPFLEFCVKLEQADRQAVAEFISICPMYLSARLRADMANSEKWIQAVHLFEQLREDIRFNVSTGHIAGKVLATLFEEKRS